MNTYEPTPIDTSAVVLSTDLVEFTEALARNVHEVWAAGRIAEGWTYGAERNDTLKHHPYLVPYDNLPEAEREYDRRTAMETVRVIVGLGYEIVKR